MNEIENGNMNYVSDVTLYICIIELELVVARRLLPVKRDARLIDLLTVYLLTTTDGVRTYRSCILQT